MDDTKKEFVIISVENIRDSITFGEFKRRLVDKHRDNFIRAAENSGLPSDRAALLVALRLDGMRDQSSVNDHVRYCKVVSARNRMPSWNFGSFLFKVTLRSLHLPLNNSWTARLVRRYRAR